MCQLGATIFLLSDPSFGPPMKKQNLGKVNHWIFVLRFAGHVLSWNRDFIHNNRLGYGRTNEKSMCDGKGSN